jgi:aminopeptidase-like protein
MRDAMIEPDETNRQNMWGLMAALFPLYRSLCGPGFLMSLREIQKCIPLEIAEYASGSKVFDWTIPKEFKVNEAYVEGPDGRRYLDFSECNYHLWLYSEPFLGEMDHGELVKHIACRPDLPNAVPLRNVYYRSGWGFSASKQQLDLLPLGRYKIHIDTELAAGFLRIGEYYLPGSTRDEIMITSYLCHPLGANDNLSGVVVSTELFRLLSMLPERRYSYRLVIWPETIGSITYIASHPDRIKSVIGGYVATCVGDGGDFTYKQSFEGSSITDRAAVHALKHSGHAFKVIAYRHDLGSDECQFNAVGLRLPFGSIMRSMYACYPEYHSSADDLSLVQPQYLYESLKLYWDTIMVLERNRIYRAKFKVDPFLTGHGIYPWDQGAGSGGVGSASARAYYHLMGGADGKDDLLAIADRAGEPIQVFSSAVSDFLRAGLIEEVDRGGANGDD